MVTEPLDSAELLRAGGGSRGPECPPGTVIGHVHLHVGDLDGAEAFYHSALGFDKVVWSYPGALFLSAGGYHHHLGTNTWAAGPPAAAEDQPRLLSWDIVVPDGRSMQAPRRRAFATRVSRYERVGDAWEARDPWGHAGCAS